MSPGKAAAVAVSVWIGGSVLWSRFAVQSTEDVLTADLLAYAGGAVIALVAMGVYNLLID